MYVPFVALLIPGARLFFCSPVFRLIALHVSDASCFAAVFLCCIDLNYTLLVSLSFFSSAAALLLSRPPVCNSVFDVKHLDGSPSAWGLSFTVSHDPDKSHVKGILQKE